MMVKGFAALLVVLLASVSCSGPTDPSKNTVEPFSGAVQPFGAGPVHPFNIQNTGEFTVSVTAMTPGNAFLGVSFGQSAGNGCAAFQQNLASSSNLGRTVLSGSITIKGQYCVQLFDPVGLVLGGAVISAPLAVAQNYTVQVSHP
jgi:hypothetical protein